MKRMLLALLLVIAADPPNTVIQGRSAGSIDRERFDTGGRGSFSPDSKRLLTVDGRSAILWDVATGRELRRFTGFNADVRQAYISPDGTKAAAVGGGRLKIFDLASGKEIISRESPDWYHFAYSPDGKSLAAFAIGQYHGTVHVLDAATLATKKTFECRMSSVGDFGFITNAKVFTKDSVAFEIYDISAGKRVFSKNISGYSPAAVSADGTRLIAEIAEGGGKRPTHRIFDGEGKEIVDLGPTAYEHRFIDGVFSKDGLRLIASFARPGPDPKAEAGSLQVFEIGKSAPLLNVPLPVRAMLALSPDERFALAGALLIDVKTGAIIRRFEGRAHSTHFVGFSLDGQSLISVTNSDERMTGKNEYGIRTWDLLNGRLAKTVNLPGQLSLMSGVSPIVMTSDRKYLAIEALKVGKGEGHLVDLEQGKIVRPLTGMYFSNGAAFSPDGKTLAQAKYDKGWMHVRLTNTLTGKTTWEFKDKFWGQVGEVLVFSPNGKRLAVGGRNKTNAVADMDIIDLETKRIDTMVITGERDAKIAVWSMDSSLLMISAESKLHFLDVAAKKVTATLPSGELTMGLSSMAVSPDGKWLATGGEYSGLRIYDIAAKKQVYDLPVHTDKIMSVAFSPDSKRVASAGDQSLALVDVEKGELVARFVAVGETDYATITPSGHYMASRGASAAIHFSRGLDILPFESFDLVFNRPDLVLARIGLASKKRTEVLQRAYERRVASLGFDIKQLSAGEMHLPEIAILGSTPLDSSSRKLSFEVRADDSLYALDRLNLYVNDVPVQGSRGIKVAGGKSLTKSVELELHEGRNKIEVSTQNEKGVESVRRSFEVTYTGAKRTKTLFVVAIGVSDYGKEQFNLTYAAKDARDLTAALQQARGELDRVEVLPFLDRAATRDAIIAAREKLMASTVDDQVIVFVAGHGLLDEKLDYYFATADVDFDAPAARGLPYAGLEGLLDGIPARRKLLLMDTCFSGEVDKSSLVAAAPPKTEGGQVKARAVGTRGLTRRTGASVDDSMELVRELFADLRRGSGAVVISSAGGAEFAFESSAWQNGVFTFAVLSGLKTKKADGDRDGKVRVSELRDFVTAKVLELTGGQQKPTARQENLGYDFTVY